MSSKKGGKEVPTPDQVDDGSPPGTAVDFIFRTMIQRASAPGKRQIRPKNVDDLLRADIQEFGSDEDPDFDVSKDKHHGESDVSIESEEEGDSGEVDSTKGSMDTMDGNADDSDEEDDDYDANKDQRIDTDSSDSEAEGEGSSTEESSEEENDLQSPVQKKSALRETLQKLNDSEFAPQQKRKRKRPKKATNSAGSTIAKGKGTTKKSEDSSSNINSNKKSKPRSSAKSKESSKSDKKTGQGGKKKVSLVVRGSKTKSNKGRVDDKIPKKKKKKTDDGSGRRSITNVVSSMEKSQKENRKEIDVGSPICSACLGKTSDGMNEIVECDSCSITVHEACYGVSDTLSVSSGSGSSCSTEPWFCDACRTGAKFISCELCPMKGGLFKETTGGRWVHLVCALYSPGVSIGDNGLPNLFDIPYTKWGAHACSVCDDVRLSRSGICTPCDAGMCKTYLHATCAQKHGLLSDPVPQTSSATEEADPFYAACKLHTSREIAKLRSKRFAILQEQLRIKKQQRVSENLSAQERHNQIRIRRKLERIRFKVAIKQAHSYSHHSSKSKYSPIPLSICCNSNSTLTSSLLPPLPAPTEILPQSWREGHKKARLLQTSAGTAISFLRKADLMGLDTQSLELEDKHSRIVTSVTKKWNVLPGLGVEFAAYYADRENRITNLSEQCEKLEKDNHALNDQQSDLQGDYDQHYVHHQLMSEDSDTMRGALFNIAGIVKNLCPPTNKKLTTAVNGMVSASKVDSPSASRRRSPSYSKSTGGKPSPKSGVKKLKKNVSMSPLPLRSGERLSMKVCSMCNKAEDQPWIIRCDHCKKFYHLKCLDPPLTRIPKRSRLCGWMCSDCGEEELEAEDPEVDTEAPRTLRGRTKIRKPGKYRHSTDSREGDLKIVCENMEFERPTGANLNSVLTSPLPMKVELPLSSPSWLTNGSTKSRKKQKSGSSCNTPSLTSPSTQSRPLPPTPTINDEAKLISTPKKPKTSLKKSPAASATPLSTLTEGAVPQKGRVRKPRKLTTDGDTSNKSKPDATKPKLKNAQLKQEGQEATTPTNPIKRRRKKSIPEEGDPANQGTPKNGPVAKKSKGPKSSKSTPAAAETVTQIPKEKKKRPRIQKSESDISTPTPKKRTKKSLGKSGVDKHRENIIIGSMMAAAAEVKKKGKDEKGLLNGTTDAATVKKRRASSASGRSGSSFLSPKTSGFTPVEKEKSIPPKKRKRVASSTPQELTNQAATIDAVALGNFESGMVPEENQKNGIARSPLLPSGILMHGVSQMKCGFSNADADPNEHSIMKGHAMGSNFNSDDYVTVKASDLIDCVIDAACAPTTSSSYTPGFYSNSTATNASSDSINLSSTLFNKTSPTSTIETEKNKPAPPLPHPMWGQSQNQHQPQPYSQQQPREQESQNVIKLHYESPDASTTTAAYVPTTPTPTPVVTPLSSPTPSSTSSPAQPSSTGSSKCFSCNKDEFKRNMVTCDKCAHDFHFMCLRPPLKYSPRRRGYSWFCYNCDDEAAAALKALKAQTPQKDKESPTPPAQPSPSPSQQSSQEVILPEKAQSHVTVRIFDDQQSMRSLMNALQFQQ